MIYRGEKCKILLAATTCNQYATAAAGTPTPLPEHPPAITPTANFIHYPGVVETATLPDPQYDWQPYWVMSVGTQSRRTASQFYRGNANFTAALSDIVLLNGKILHLPIGSWGSSGTSTNSGVLCNSVIQNTAIVPGGVDLDITTPGALANSDFVRIGDTGAANVEYRTVADSPDPFTIAAATYHHAVGEAVVEVDDITLSQYSDGSTNVATTRGVLPGYTYVRVSRGADTAAAAWVNGDYIGLGYGSARSEIRRVTAYAANIITVDHAFYYHHPVGEGITRLTVNGNNTVTHTAYDTFDLPSVSMNVGFYDDENTVGLVRRWLDGKVNSATITAREGDLVRMSLGEIIFRAEAHNMSTLSAAQGYSSSVADPALVTSETDPGYFPLLTYPSTQPYYFSYGALTMRIANTNYVVARVRSFDLSINNNIEQKRYVAGPMGRLVVGTGTATGAPFSFGDGVTTVTALTAGTFTVTLPTGSTATATSGTATVTGSPQALVAGANTVDTGVTTGTFTITMVSNFSSFFAPYELREGRKTYELGMVLDLGDESGSNTMSKNEIFRDLMRQQMVSGSVVGAQVTLVLTRPRTDMTTVQGDSITITLPPNTPANGLDTQGCVLRSANYNIVTDPIIPVNMTMIAPRCTIAVTERNSANDAESASYPWWDYLYL